ncbi:heavy metal translocating P-type ATPase [[Ruminococcus] gnavus]|uniref:Cd(2+)-exporting ATPase n=1 Tax=Mediterraneibacter gnavus TaxID=33038 RepID=A0AAW6JYC4_MEDGN|nr:heavy metal translocating P-type ATPase [Mediterraneibacter gnavus]MDC6138436.1 heavy metal translocating P-type ATPase [Mediterraneibacter gnavus]MDE1202002.1 heavy metal translocating P-type ATPase [Mediterraneibacter gnavus]RHH42301.1 heavy metal translocating P-type ATPase [Mediterraneibacter gnavus]RJW23547.1 heavy metal translocating P-type ATPase [Lachnospiraceae bacterium TM07-2AC]
MKFIIKHEIPGRIRVHMVQPKMTFEEADILLYYLVNLENVTKAKVYERTQDAVIYYEKDRREIIKALQKFGYDRVTVPEGLTEHSGRQMNAEYQEKLLMKVVMRFGGKLLIPAPVRAVWTGVRSLKYLQQGIASLKKGRLEVAALDATAIGVSILRRDMNTASSIMFLLGIGELLEEWTHKKSVGDLARDMSLNVGKVWLLREEQEILVPTKQIEPEDLVVVRMGNVIPFDGVVSRGEAMVNQASMTGEAVPVKKTAESYVYAGTVVEEGELIICVKAVSKATRFEKIVTMIEESEKLKSNLESHAEHLADQLVPYTLAGTILTWLLTRDVTKALAVLMVDFSCALKLAIPISVLSAIREAGAHNITVKGGKYMEAAANATTIVFDKTGTLTEARPTVRKVVSFCEQSEDELLRMAACLEEHFPHSMAKAVVEAARKRGLEHEEMHSKVNYIVAHGISSTIEGKRVVIGSHHFVFEDEKCSVREPWIRQFETLPEECSLLYLAIEHELAAVVCIEDPLRKEAADVVRALKATGLEKVVMMTGDSEKTAASVARRVGVDAYYSEVLPEDKAKFVEQERASGRTVIMIGDGINDSPALSAANVGIAIRDGAQIAQEIADITISAENLWEIVMLRRLSEALMRRIQKNYRSIVGINATLILLGVTGILQPTTSALLHNMSTLTISLTNMKNLLDEN